MMSYAKYKGAREGLRPAALPHHKQSSHCLIASLSHFLILGFLFLIFSSCSTTRRLADDQTLYTGVRKMHIEGATGTAADGIGRAKVPGSVAAAVKEPLSVKPNNPLFSPWVRTPLPIGLWAYNSFYTTRTKGFRAWLYRSLAKQPVIVERDVQPAARTEMARDILDNHGYFGSAASFELVPRHNPKKSKVNYNVAVARPWHYADVRFWADSLAATSNVRRGEQYNIDTLLNEQQRITGMFRRRGYYYFSPEFIEYQADTVRERYSVDLRVNLRGGIPPAALAPYRVGEVSLQIFSADGTGSPDSITVRGAKVWHQGPLQLRRRVLRRTLTLDRGEAARLGSINRMLTNLTRLGVFRYVNLQVPPLDSLRVDSLGRPLQPLDLVIAAAMDTPMEATIEADLAYKSSSFLGPSLTLGLSHKNIFHGGEVLGLTLAGAYEWQTGNTSQGANSTTVNSYEISLTGSLTLPRMIAPNLITHALPRGGSTSYQIGTSLVNRPKFFRMASLNFTNTYDFRTSSTVSHSLTPLKIVYNRLLTTTGDFDAMMDANPAVALSFADQFIPSGSYTFTYDKRHGRLRGDRTMVQVTLMSAGNVWGLVGANSLFGQPLSQFFKETAELRHFHRLGHTGTLALRLFAGAGHAYGNSTVMPYTEQFYIGGANSIRAFTIRSLGPGGNVPNKGDRYGYFDQTGDLKLEANLEYRFRIVGPLNGAVFFDAGNIWLQKNDPSRPLGKIGSGGFFNQIATGTGAGVRYDLSFLVIRVDAGVGIHLPYDTGVRSSGGSGNTSGRRPYYNIPRFRDGLGLHLAIGYPF